MIISNDKSPQLKLHEKPVSKILSSYLLTGQVSMELLLALQGSKE